jgi:hypothetical protein
VLKRGERNSSKKAMREEGVGFSIFNGFHTIRRV